MERENRLENRSYELNDITTFSQDLTPLREQPEFFDDDQFPDGGIKASLVVAGSLVGLIATFGLLNSVGAIQGYISTHQLANVPPLTVSWIFSVFVCLSYLGGVLVGPLFDAKGSTLPLIGGLVLMAGGLLATAQCTEVWQFILALSICVGLGVALCFTPLIGVVAHWYLVKRGRATGLATTGGSIGGIVIPLMLRSLYTKVGFEWAIRVLALFCAICILVGVIFARDRAQQIQEIRNKSRASFDHVNDDIEETIREDRSVWRKVKKSYNSSKHFFDFNALKDFKYTWLIGGAVLCEISLVITVTYLSTYAVTYGMSQSDSYILITVLNAVGILGRWVLGHGGDKIGRFNMQCIMTLGCCLSTLVIWLPFGSNAKVLWAFSCIYGFFLALVFLLTPVCLSQITPVLAFGARYGLMNCFVSIGPLICYPIAASIIGDSSKHSYDLFVAFCGALFGVGFICWYSSRYCMVGMKLNVKV